jgi:hypothetical protein
MPIFGLDLDATKEFVSRFEREGEPNPTRWKLRTLDSRIMGRIRDMASTVQIDPLKGDVAQTVNIREVDFQTVAYGLAGWENFNEAKGTKLDYKTIRVTHGGQAYEVVDPEVQRRIPVFIIEELAEAIRQGNLLTEDETKNSDA